jgi:hypothetical protein
LSISRRSVYQAFKYTIYALLTLNVYLFFAEEIAASEHQFRHGVAPGDLIEAFAATIDTAAWVILLLMFELETYILEDEDFTKPVTFALHTFRAICYGFIVYAFYGYIVNLTSLFNVSSVADLSNLCALASDQWAYATTLDEFADITAANCVNLSSASSFLQFDGMRAVVDASGLTAMRMLAWVDVVNAAVWILVVVILEVDVRLQEKNLLEGTALRISQILKVIFYSLLFLAAIYWGVAGDFVDFWDAFLWLVAFVFIEMNVFEWRQEAHANAALVESV